MTAQQEELALFFRRSGKTIRELSSESGIEKTRLWRVLAGKNEMVVSEYLKLIALYGEYKGLSIEKGFFFLGWAGDKPEYPNVHNAKKGTYNIHGSEYVRGESCYD